MKDMEFSNRSLSSYSQDYQYATNNYQAPPILPSAMTPSNNIMKRNPKWVSVSTIPPLDSVAWQKLSRFQQRFYRWLIHNHDIPVSEMSEYENLQHHHQQQQPPQTQHRDPNDYQSGQPRIPYYTSHSEVRANDYPGLTPSEVGDEYSPYYGMDSRLAQFVSEHNIVMDDGAVAYAGPLDPLSKNVNQKYKKQFRPPCSCTLYQFKLTITMLVLLALIVIVAIVLGTIYSSPQSPEFPVASPWWTHGLMYQIHVPTWANDLDGSVIGRIRDVSSRLVYLANRLHVTAVTLTGILERDVTGVRNWKALDPTLNPEGEDPGVLLNGLKMAAEAQGINMLLGAPLYATSRRHPWFLASESAVVGSSFASFTFQNFYMWRKEPPINAIEGRFFSYNAIRKEYYRHVHGAPNTPLLNLADPNVQTELQSVIAFWKKTLGIYGILITNSTNVLPEMANHLNAILATGLDTVGDKFMWFADTVPVDSLLQNKQICYFELMNKERIITRTEDISAQLNLILQNPRLKNCSPIWRIVQNSEDFTDYFSLHKLASFLPGMNLIVAGEEVELMNGRTELIQWQNKDPNDFSTFWPINVVLGSAGIQRISDFDYLGTRMEAAGIFATGWRDSQVAITPIPLTENLFVIRRTFVPTGHMSIFFVSFQTLNAYTQLASVIPESQLDSVRLIYEGRRIYSNSINLDWIYLINNDVFMILI